MKYAKILLSLTGAFLLSACAPDEMPVNKGGYYYSGIYFGTNLSDAYKKGIQDGCQTAKGTYTKSHWFFQNKKTYADGWFLGRNKCRNLLKIDKNGDLIL